SAQLNRWMRPSRTIAVAQTTEMPIVIRLRFRSATPAEPIEELIPPPHMSERPPPFPFCMSMARMRKILAMTSSTSRWMRRASTSHRLLSVSGGARAFRDLTRISDRGAERDHPAPTRRGSPSRRPGDPSEVSGVVLVSHDRRELLGLEARPADEGAIDVLLRH